MPFSLRRPLIVNGKQQGITLAVCLALSDGVNAHVAARLTFQPTRSAPLCLTKHTPPSDLSSTTPHFYDSGCI
ncbi:hypothetical protein M2371_002096 [Buttiauxella sp. BIGb0471]|nr:hypothetical protein [Buttiauxella sp. BIGb0471]